MPKKPRIYYLTDEKQFKIDRAEPVPVAHLISNSVKVLDVGDSFLVPEPYKIRNVRTRLTVLQKQLNIKLVTRDIPFEGLRIWRVE